MLLRLLSATATAYDHAVVSLKDEGTVGPRIKELGIPVYALGLSPDRPNPFRILSIRSLARRLQPDLIQGWMYHGNVMASLARSGLPKPVPVLWGIHQSLDMIGGWGRSTKAVIRLGAWLSGRPAATVYVSRVGARQHQAIGYDPTRSLVIPNGIDCTVFVPDEIAREAVRSELGIPPDSILIGLVARYHPMKDHIGFLRAAKLVAGAHPDARFLLVGKGVSTQAAVLAKIQELELQDRVLLLGERDDMHRITASLDINCSSSAWGEAFSVAVAESMSCGIPCVVTDVGDNGYVVSGTGITVPPADPTALARGIAQLIEAGRTGRQHLGELARRRIETEFSLSLVARRYTELYQQYLTGV